jgi:hypothetical protein
MALGVPATVKEGVVEPGHFDFGWQSYVDRAKRIPPGPPAGSI